jgi:hypothetical protein
MFFFALTITIAMVMCIYRKKKNKYLKTFSPCRGLKNILRMHVKKVNCSEWEQIPVPSR